jgi:quinol monooxygenase YgiN
MIIVAGTITMPAENVAAATSVVTKLVAATRAEPGNLAYVLAEVLGSPGTIQVFEQWRDDAALAEHFRQPHMAEFRAASAAFGITSMNILKYEAGEGQPLR